MQYPFYFYMLLPIQPVKAKLSGLSLLLLNISEVSFSSYGEDLQFALRDLDISVVDKKASKAKIEKKSYTQDDQIVLKMCLYIICLVAWIHSGEAAIKTAIKMGHKQTNPLKQIKFLRFLLRKIIQFPNYLGFFVINT